MLWQPIDHSHKNQGLFPKNSIFFSRALVHLGQGMRTGLEQTAEPKRSSADLGTSVFPFAFPWYFPYAFPLSEQRGCARVCLCVCLSVSLLRLKTTIGSVRSRGPSRTGFTLMFSSAQG